MQQLTHTEKTICARTGISESEYLAQKGRNTAGPMTVQINPAEIAVAMNLDPRDYSARRVSGRRPGAMARFASGIDGRAIIEEARLEHAHEINDEGVSTDDLIAEAREALDEFDIADEEAWRKLAFAAACIQGALERHAPPYANREPYGKAEADRRHRAAGE